MHKMYTGITKSVLESRVNAFSNKSNHNLTIWAQKIILDPYGRRWGGGYIKNENLANSFFKHYDNYIFRVRKSSRIKNIKKRNKIINNLSIIMFN